jgi:hypothetical protein
MAMAVWKVGGPRLTDASERKVLPEKSEVSTGVTTAEYS